MLVDFYQLGDLTVEQVLPRICERVLGEGGRMLVVAPPPLLKLLDERLWTYAAESFLPHGPSTGDRAAEQPVLLSPDVSAANGATNVAIADGEWRSEALGFARTFYFFGAERLDDARSAWRSLAGQEGAERRYWRHEQGRWRQGP